MLDKMRKNVSSFFVKGIISIIVLAFIGTIFLVWGVGDHKEREGRAIAKVFGEDVPHMEYVTEYRQLYEYYRNQFKDNWSEDMAQKLQLKKTALDNIINRRVLIHEANKQGISVNDEEVMNKIKSMPMFQQNNKFDSRLYARILEYGIHMEPSAFEDKMKEGLIIDRVQDRIRGSIKVSKKELLDTYSQQNEKVLADYMLVSSQKLIPEITLSPEEMQTYFENNKTTYELPRGRKIQYIYLNSQDFKKSINIDDESIQKHYESHKSQYEMQEQVRASHILIKTNSQDAAPLKEEAGKKAQDLLTRIKAGEDFAKLAQEFSQDPGSAAKGGDLGYFSKGRMTPTFEEAAFSLGKGEISDIVESPFGYHIIKVEEIQEAYCRPLVEVKPQIINQLLDEKAWEEAEEKAENLVRSYYKTGKLEEIATKEEYALGQTEFAQDAKFIPGVGRSEEFVKVAFELKPDEISMPVEANAGFYILRLLEEIPPRIPELAKVEDKVAQDLKKEKAELKTKELAEEIHRKLRAGEGDFLSLAEEYKLAIKDTGEISRVGYIKSLGSVPELTSALFNLKEGEFTSALKTESGYCLAVLKKRISVDLQKFEQEEAMLREQTLRSKEQQLMNAWVERLKKEHNIIVDYNAV